MQKLDPPITDLLPHAAPMVLLDRLCHYTANKVQCELTIQPDSYLYDPQQQGVPNYVALEYMAQTIGVIAGLEAKARADKVKLGFLLGTRRCQLHTALFSCGEVLQITAERVWQEDESGLAVFACQVTGRHQQCLAEAQLNVYQPHDIDAFFQEGAA
ncbi:hypothetical protein BFW38_13950 [Terasakiispira papahanaumokuakeensis]|uniref:3-hydroxylacyl-ACP dehydratase n=1 Tax=Terasakiispira papahanaumokuakeensis TaxID=197479 RepID=A0A1E2VC99_9GAMM|nr:hotdog family protein [Terasakiispira papahanaumokuakeensis]ODC04472.1 hypothetical protein BFW38_13950 [Terasakiispira papahanaumokuakeensis]